MLTTPACRYSRHWLATMALVGLASTLAGCGGRTGDTPPESAKPAEAQAGPAASVDEADAPLPPPVVRNRPAGSREELVREAVHRRLRRDGGPPDHPRGGHLQPHVLLRGQGRAARGGLRVREGLRRRGEQEVQDGQREGQRRLHPAAARPPGTGPDPGQGRPGRCPGHREAGTAGAGGLHEPDADERQRDRRDGAWRPRDRVGRRPVGEGRLRPQGQQVPREPRRAEREAGGRGQATSGHTRGPRQPRRR